MLALLICLLTGGGYPIQSCTWGVPHPVLDPPSTPGMGYPRPDLRLGTLHPDLGWGYPHQQDGIPSCPDLGWGTPCPHQQDGVPPPPSRPEMGYLSPPLPEMVDKVKTLPSVILWMRAVKMQQVYNFLIFQNYFTQYVAEFRRVVTNLREKCRAESTSVDSDDWTWFQHSLRVIQTCGEFVAFFLIYSIQIM